MLPHVGDSDTEDRHPQLGCTTARIAAGLADPAGLMWYSIWMRSLVRYSPSLSISAAVSLAGLFLTACTSSAGKPVQAPEKVVEARQPTAPATEIDPRVEFEPTIESAVETEQPAPETKASGPARPIELTFVGDVMFGRWREEGLREIDYKNFDVFGPMRDLMASDLVLANLETPLVRYIPEKPPYGTRLRFAAPPEAAAYMRRSGITAVTLANNHSFDMKFTGLHETPEILEEHGIVFFGRTRKEPPLFRVEPIEVEGWKIGFLAATGERNGPQRKNAPELPYVHPKKTAAALVPVIEEAKGKFDLIIVLLHWGLEYKERSTTVQIRAVRALIDAGADAVIAHHPHVLQAIEQYKNGLIAYSIGNFLFDNASDPLKFTGVLRLRYEPKKRCLERAVLHPAYVQRSPTYHPRPANNSMRKRVRERVIRLSREKPFRTEWKPEGKDLVLASPPCPASDEE